MPLLRADFCTLLTVDTIRKLKQAGVNSVTEFLIKDIEMLSSQTGIPYKDITCIREALISKFAPVPENAVDLYSQLFKDFAIFSSGCSNLDTYIDGIYSGEITEIVGKSSSGKTQFCFGLATSVALETKRCVLHLDTNGSFSALRIYELASASNASDDDIQEAMKRIHPMPVNDIFHLLTILNNPQMFVSNLGVIIIDSIFSLLYPHLPGKQHEGMRLMVQASQLLSKVAKRRHLAVVVCNSLVQGENYDFKPALGRYWQHVPSVRIQLSPVDLSLSASGGEPMGKLRRVLLLKSPRQASGKSLLLELGSAGFTEST